MRNFIWYITACISFFSCNEKPLNQEAAENDIVHLMSTFCLNHHSGQKKITNKNSMIFAKKGRWDASYIILLSKTDQGIDVAYHEIDVFNDYYNLNSDSATNIFFQGFYFEIAKAEWKKISEKSILLLDSTDAEPYESGILDGVEYILSHDGRSALVNKRGLVPNYERFSTYILDSLVNPIKKQRVLPRESLE
jgi:hypothetical protein